MGSDKVIVLCEDRLCEDRAQEKPIRAWLEELGYNPRREVRFEAHPEASQGKTRNRAWVEQNYPILMKQQRSRAPRMQCSLVVCLDADVHGVVDVEQAMDARLVNAQANPLPRGQSENVALLIPNRNIETWLLFLAGQAVNETQDFKTFARSVDLDATPKQFALMATGKTARLPAEPPSLQHALDDECPRIPKC